MQAYNTKILVVDDNRDFANILCSYFRYLDFTAKAAYNELTAAEKIITFQPDIVFCDIGLPKRGGYTLADLIRSDRMLRDTYLVALTYFYQERIRLFTLEHGFDAYISRPIQSAHLQDILTQAELRKMQSGRSMALDSAG